MAKEELIIDMGNKGQKMKLLSKIGALVGVWRIDLRPYKPQRSLKSNAFYWVAIVPTFQEFMREHGQIFDSQDVHEFFLQRFAARPVIDPLTGEVLNVIGKRSSQMSQDEFSDYVGRIKEWLLDKFNVICPEPELR